MAAKRINDLTSTEIHDLIVEAQLHKAAKHRPCLLCGTVVAMRPDQHFCSSRCRTDYHREAVKISLALQAKEQEQWRLLEQSYLKEINDLKKQIQQLQTKGPD